MYAQFRSWNMCCGMVICVLAIDVNDSRWIHVWCINKMPHEVYLWFALCFALIMGPPILLNIVKQCEYNGPHEQNGYMTSARKFYMVTTRNYIYCKSILYSSRLRYPMYSTDPFSLWWSVGYMCTAFLSSSDRKYKPFPMLLNCFLCPRWLYRHIFSLFYIYPAKVFLFQITPSKRLDTLTSQDRVRLLRHLIIIIVRRCLRALNKQYACQV